ncbi:serine carboxypeptidase S28-domain-containing protein [Mycena floridula]|nr:serine carboxypeptidase S28-domain-containing protein [Mycena floridula]
MVAPWKAALLLTGLACVEATLRDGRAHANMAPAPSVPRIVAPDTSSPVVSRNGTQLPPYNTTFYFDQLIDHNNPSAGTFKQRFWHTWEFYEAGGPIILMTPGEGNADGYSGYLTNITINGRIAQQQNGSTIVIEHRFYGLSNPKPDLSVESLRLHTLQQAVDDLVYFAKTVNLPMPGGDKVTPDKAPWILIGGSYSGALTSWTMVNKPGVFWAGYASSAVVEAIVDYWAYFEPIREHMPSNCSADVEKVIAHVDKVFSGKNTTAIQALKETFGLGSMTHLDDVAGALRNNLWDWQSLSPSVGPNAQFFQFCDALEVKDGVNAPATGWGLDHAVEAWGSYFANVYFERLCGDLDAETCLGSYDPTQDYWTDTSVDNANRSWFWIVCNQVGYLQEGPPVGRPAVVTRLVQPSYDTRQCQMMFPAAFKTPPNALMAAGVAKTNAVYRGWDVKLTRLFFANAFRDPWRDATISAEGRNTPSTATQPIFLSDGFHCSDLGVKNALVDPTVANVQTQALKFMAQWVPQYKPAAHTVKREEKREMPRNNVWFRDSPVA